MARLTRPLEFVGGPMCGSPPHRMTRNEEWYGCVFMIDPDEQMVHQYQLAYTLLTPDGEPYLQHVASVRIGTKRLGRRKRQQ